MLGFFHQIIAGIIAVGAAAIISLGIVKMPPAPLPMPFSAAYKIAEKKLTAETPKEIIAPKKLEAPKPANLPAAVSSAPNIIPEKIIPQPIEQPAINLIELNAAARKAIVNIICVSETGGYFQPITGSGVIISPKGIILTNAHIGQYFLLENYPVENFLDCQIRRGDIAAVDYGAKLIYISSAWVEKNAENIILQEPKGTGENDYALLAINKSAVQGKDLPPSFSFLEPDFNFKIIPDGLTALLISYPAGFLGGISIQKDLGLVSTFAEIKKLYTFSQTEPALDIFSLGGNIAAQAGSSGGAIRDTKDGKLIGIVTTSTEATSTAGRTLNAISLPSINRSFKAKTGESLESVLLNNPAESILKFFPETEFNRLKNLLIQQLEKK